MSEVPYKVVGKKDGRRTWYHILDANKNTVDTWPERGHAVAACSLANYAHAHATDAAARRVRELEDREGILLEALEACRTNDRSDAYEYGEKRKLDEAAPPKGKRWNTPFEISRDAIGEWAKAVFGAVGVQSLKQALAGKERTDGAE